jgi:hypothetical protein
MAVEKVDGTTRITETSYEEAQPGQTSQATATESAPPDDGRDTKLGEHEMFAAMRRAEINGAAIAGGMMGMLTNSLKAANDELKKNAEAQAEGVKFVVGLAFSFIPGAGSKLGAGVENAIAKTIIEKTFDGIQGKVLELIRDGATEQAKQLILNQYKNKDPQVMLFGLFNALNQTIPNGDQPGEQNFLTQFQSSYGTAVNSPYRITR